MSIIQPSDVSRIALQRAASEPTAVRPDFQFWQDVFDQAQGSSPQGASGHGFEANECPGITEEQGRSEHTQTSVPATPVLSEQGLATAKTVTHAMAQALRSSAALPPSTLPYAQTSAMPLQGGAASEANDADMAAGDTTRRGAHQVLADDILGQAALQAHVMLTEAGDWKVALRTGRHVSAAQALSAVAQALAQHPQGRADAQVEQVVLNGKPIYQRGADRDAGQSASSTFELDC